MILTRRFTWLDFLLIILVVFAALLIFPALKSFTPGSAVVYLDNRVIAEYPLDTDRIFKVQGKESSMEIEISDKSVSVLSSSCPHQICVISGRLSGAYNQIVCVPNHILITLKAAGEKELDAITQ